MLGLIRPETGSATRPHGPFWAVRQHVAFVAQADETDWDFPSRVRDLVAMGAGVPDRPDRAAGAQTGARWTRRWSG